MRAEVDPQAHSFAYFSQDARVPADHPLRSIKACAEAALERIAAELEARYGSTGRASIPPERLAYNPLFRWFLGMSLDERGLDQSNFPRLRERLVDTDVARRNREASADVSSRGRSLEMPQAPAARSIAFCQSARSRKSSRLPSATARA